MANTFFAVRYGRVVGFDSIEDMNRFIDRRGDASELWVPARREGDLLIRIY